MARTFRIPIDLGKLELQNARVQNLASAPGSPVAGQIYFDTSDNTLKYWDGSAWQSSASVTFATPAIALGSSAAAGSAGTVIRSDSTIAAFDTTVPHTQAFGESAATGSAAVASRRDHRHGMPAHALATHQELIATADLTDWPRTAALSLGSQKITDLAEPTLTSDAATKGYVDGKAQGLDFKDSVRAATAAALPTNTRSGNVLTASANGALPAIDGVTLAANDRVLVKNEGTGANNGPYSVTDVGSGSTPWTLTRTTDADSSAEVNPGLYTFVEEGTVEGNSAWTLTTDAPITLNTTALTFAVFGRAGDIVAGMGLTRTGQTLDVVAGAGIAVGANDVSVDTAVVARKYTTTIGDGAATSYTVTHNLGNRNAVVQTFVESSGLQIEADVTLASANTCTVAFATAPASNSVRVVVVA